MTDKNQTPLALVGETIEATRGEDGQLTVMEYATARQTLDSLEKELEGVVFDVSTAKGLKEAKAARKRVTSLRTTLEANRKKIKGPVLEITRAIDGQASELTARAKKLEDPIDEQIKTEEQRLEREKAEREAAERKRLGAIRERIERIRALPNQHLQSTPEVIEAVMDELMADPLEGFDELVREVALVRDEAMGKLYDTLTLAKLREKDQAELEELRRFKAEKVQAEKEKAAKEAAEKQAAERRQADERLQIDRDATRASGHSVQTEPMGVRSPTLTGYDSGAGDERTVVATVPNSTRSPVIDGFLAKMGKPSPAINAEQEKRNQAVDDIWNAGAGISSDVAELILDAIIAGKVAHVSYSPE